MLPSRVFIPQPPNPTQEDIFSSGLGALFTDDTQNSHGIPGQFVVYTSPLYGEIKLGIPQHPDVEEGRKLFAHYLWNAGVVAADAIEVASNDGSHQEQTKTKVQWIKRYWDVRDQDVLELGAGTALPSLVAALSSARSITITDHPSSPAIVNDTIAHNVKANLYRLDGDTSEPRTKTRIAIHGLTWGDDHFTSSTSYGKLAESQPRKHSFDKIIIADCLWMPSQHVNLVKAINSYLGTEDRGSEKVPCALVIAGFHTGRSIVGRFFEIATGSRTGKRDEETQPDNDEDDEVKAVKGTLTAAEIFEVDVDCNVRAWVPERPGESKDQAKRWVVCAALIRRT